MRSTHHIKVNLPLTEEDYTLGNGEGVWVIVDDKTKKAYDSCQVEKGCQGILDNDSLYYPGLNHGATLHFELRGKCRPVADYYGFLQKFSHLTPEEKLEIIMNMIYGRA